MIGPPKVIYIPTPLQLVATPLHWLCICQNTHLFAKRESRVNTVQNSAALEKDPLKIYAIMCNMRRLNSHRELGKFLHTAAATPAAAKLRRASLPFSRWSHFVYIATASKGGFKSEGRGEFSQLPKMSAEKTILGFKNANADFFACTGLINWLIMLLEPICRTWK